MAVIIGSGLSGKKNCRFREIRRLRFGYGTKNSKKYSRGKEDYGDQDTSEREGEEFFDYGYSKVVSQIARAW